MKAYLILLCSFTAGALALLGVQQAWAWGRAPRENAVRKIEMQLTENQLCRVSLVVDGDTVVLENGLHIRYRGVNAPETGYFLRDPAPFGAEASARNRELVEGKWVRLALGDPPVDAYGRVIARLYVQDQAQGKEVDLEALLLKEGLARLLPLGQPAGDMDVLRAAEAEAREKKAGLWGIPESEPARSATLVYGCSANSRVFHRLNAGCASARSIAAAQFKGFANLEEAVLTGRHFCSQCIRLQLKKNGTMQSADPGLDVPSTPGNEEP